MQYIQRSRVIPAGVSGGITFLALFFLQTFVSIQYFVLFLLLFVGLILGMRFFFYQQYSYQYPVFSLSLALSLSVIGLLFVIEIPIIRQIITGILVVVQAILWGWGGEQGQLTVSLKPFRRFVVFCWVFCAYAAITTLFALSAFFPQRWLFILTIFLGSVVYSAIALHIWRLYFTTSARSLFLWTLLIGVVCIEMLWVVSLLPFAYGFLACISTWFWYLLQLFTRFHFGSRGVLWKKQLPFLIGNSVVFALILIFFIRWV